MAGFLDKILKTTRLDLDARKASLPLEQLKQEVFPRQAGRFRTSISAPGISVIAEVKRASPSKGDIRPDLVVSDVVKAYERGGARAVSVLTEERYFKGSLEDLRQARASVDLPILRKDFIMDPYQVWEAAEAGADAVLLIVAALKPDSLNALMREAVIAGLDTLVEIHSPAELESALNARAPIIGINNRDLATFEVNLQTTLDLAKSIPHGTLTVSESGISSREDVLMLAEAGVDAVLVGETLMRNLRPEDKLRELLAP